MQALFQTSYFWTKLPSLFSSLGICHGAVQLNNVRTGKVLMQRTQQISSFENAPITVSLCYVAAYRVFVFILTTLSEVRKSKVLTVFFSVVVLLAGAHQ